jgi:ribosome maturation factor RimP
LVRTALPRLEPRRTAATRNGLRAHFLFVAARRNVKKAIDKEGLIELLEPTLRTLGYELVDLEVNVGRHGFLRLYIDKEPGVTLSDCEFVSGQIGAFLDVEDPLPGSYVLEVSSPGLDRRLRTGDHFRRFKNEQAKIELLQPRDGRRRIKGRISDVQGTTVTVDVDGVEWQVDISDIGVARLVPQK